MFYAIYPQIQSVGVHPCTNQTNKVGGKYKSTAYNGNGRLTVRYLLIVIDQL